MGSIKGKWIKKMATKLIELYPDKFTNDFEKNKQAVNELELIEDKSVRNKVAGLLTSRSGKN
ncbi:unnamed protein product [marine sediment metagenome]|uniref:30S ribosomal protein S17e n=1 Tax=marine sediment metagenome TaxID=412755 RepID=X0ZF35_9ZZZZ